MNSFGLLKTNVGLTTNIKIMVDSLYQLSLDSIESSDELSLDRFKKLSFTKNNYFDELIPFFYKDTPSDIAFRIKYNSDSDSMGNNFSDQYDELYQYGARNISNNKSYKEEFEYFAPLYINKNKLPKNFIIFRVDGNGLGLLSKDNFKSEILNKFKTVKLFDLTKNTQLGEWMDKNFSDNVYFPPSPLEIDFRNLEFCRWNGIDYQTGGYTSKSLFIDDVLDEEKEIFELEKFVFDNYKNSKVVFPNILNFSFLFDDEPSTPELQKKWSLNRYYGFYLEEMELVKTISPYITPLLKNDVIILDGNILSSPLSNDPFIEGWSDNRPFYIEYDGVYYKVEKFEENLGITLQQNNNNGFVSELYQSNIITKYRIISSINLAGLQSNLNRNFGIIDQNNTILNYDLSNYQIENFNDADLWIIEIDGIYHNLISDDTSIKIFSDYSFNFNENDYTYKVANIVTKVDFSVNILNEPKKFKIFKLKLSDIKAFDDKIIDTEYSKYEYEKLDELTNTDESKMYFDDILSNSDPKELDDFIYKNNVVNIPVSSEYTANYETFKINNNELSDIWRINAVYCRWAYQNSISSNDHPYVFNNSLIFEDFNRSVNPFDPDPKRIERNLDYFYSINSSTASYIHHSLHIENIDENGNIDSNLKFEIDKYINSATYSFDYFTSFFDTNQEFNNKTVRKNVKKYSQFNIGDNIIPNSTLFRGIEFRLYDVEGITLNSSGEIDNINLSNSNNFEDYKLSILLSDNDQFINENGILGSSSNSMDWEIIDEWKMDKEYATSSIVIFNDILYQASTNVITDSPVRQIVSNQVKSAPYTELEWSLYNPFITVTQSIFWIPNQVYNNNDFVYSNGDYYSYNSTGNEDFWNPVISTTTGYNINDVVLFKGSYYMSLTNSNHFSPDTKTGLPFTKWIGFQNWITSYWVATQSSNSNWNPIELWNPSMNYFGNKLVINNEIVWISNEQTDGNDIPGVSPKWQRKYSLKPDTSLVYQDMNNSIIQMNNRYYMIKSNIENSTLDNGIIIYINKKWKNILININVSDNTLPNLSEADRDLIYTDLYKKLTAYNFISAINDITNKYDFTDYVSYVVINEDNTISKYNYNNNIQNLPYLIRCEIPDSLKIKISSLTKKAITLPIQLKPEKILKDGKINTLSELNYYNNTPIASEIKENKFEPKVFENYHGNKNILTDEIYRFSGYYMPLFYDIQLFKKGEQFKKIGNYKFDISLTEFGLLKERKMRKTNLNGSVLKLKNNNDIKSIYVMIDEYGYTYNDFFIFKPTWDYQYHLQTLNKNDEEQLTQISSLPENIIVGQPPLIQNIQNYNL